MTKKVGSGRGGWAVAPRLAFGVLRLIVILLPAAQACVPSREAWCVVHTFVYRLRLRPHIPAFGDAFVRFPLRGFETFSFIFWQLGCERALVLREHPAGAPAGASPSIPAPPPGPATAVPADGVLEALALRLKAFCLRAHDKRAGHNIC